MALRGKTLAYCTTGALSVQRRNVFDELLRVHSARETRFETGDVTHLISTRDATVKARSATAKQTLAVAPRARSQSN